MSAKKEDGFSYIDVMIALVILMIGILGMLSALTASVIQASGQEQQLTAKQLATSTVESIMSVREMSPRLLGWDNTRNYCATVTATCSPQGLFPTSFQPIKPGIGADKIIGTTDDTGTNMIGYQREIVITDVCDPDLPSPNCNPPGNKRVMIRQVSVTVTYQVGGLTRQENVTTVLTNYEVTR